MFMKCKAGNKKCGKRCIPQEWECDDEKRDGDAKKSKKTMALAAAGVGVIAIGATALILSKKMDSARAKVAGLPTNEKEAESYTQRVKNGLKNGERAAKAYGDELSPIPSGSKANDFIINEMKAQGEPPVQQVFAKDLSKLPKDLQTLHANEFKRGYAVIGNVVVIKDEPTKDGNAYASYTSVYAQRQMRKMKDKSQSEQRRLQEEMVNNLRKMGKLKMKEA
jgi:hypothetical protein